MRAGWSALLRCSYRQRTALTSTTPIATFSSSANNDDHSGKTTHPHEDYENQLRELAEERQALFGFTDEEEGAWSRIANNPSEAHSSAFLETIETARRQKHDPVQNISEHELQHSGPHHQNQSLTHVSDDGSSVQMVNVGSKEVTTRIARARTHVDFPSHVWDQLTDGRNDATELIGKKGPILTTAKLAGIMGAKQTSSLIPLCHPLPLEQVQVNIEMDQAQQRAIIECECKTTHKTGVEMEALTGASVAALTIYDMVKALSHEITIAETRLISKRGGKRDFSKPS